MVSERTKTALKIINANGGLTALRFAELFWPEHKAHKQYTKSGQHGVRVGAKAWLMAGSYLGRLRKRGLVDAWYNNNVAAYWLTSEGSKEVKE